VYWSKITFELWASENVVTRSGILVRTFIVTWHQQLLNEFLTRVLYFRKLFTFFGSAWNQDNVRLCIDTKASIKFCFGHHFSMATPIQFNVCNCQTLVFLLKLGYLRSYFLVEIGCNLYRITQCINEQMLSLLSFSQESMRQQTEIGAFLSCRTFCCTDAKGAHRTDRPGRY